MLFRSPNEAITLGFTPGATNNFSIKATQVNNFDAGIRIILRDNQTNTEQDLTDGTAYTISSDAVSTASRFSIIFRTTSVTTSTNNYIDYNSILVYKNAINQIAVNIPTEIVGKASVCVFNAVGQKLVNQLLPETENVLGNSYPSGIYLVSVVANGNTITRKVVIN